MKKITFKASVRSENHATIVAGWQLRCGAVIHRSIFSGGPKGRWPQRYDDSWSVSDPVSGCAFIRHAWSMGEALASYRILQAKFGARFAEAVALARQNTARTIAAERAAS